ncbi:hypothetical protein IKE87_02640 [Candidatus Saccharibacteria bacterium]|nr:hypothetical protein [Candidatus Saccharibacteria bacterium]
MNSEKLGGNRVGMKTEEQREREREAKQRERERDLARKMKMGGAALALTASIIVGAALSNSKKASEIMNNEERAKNVKKIEHVSGIVFHDTANVRQEPYVDNLEPNQSATVEIEDGSVTVDYDGDAYYYKNENDPNGGWYGFEADELAKELLENDYITKFEANDIRNDDITGDGYVWLNENNVSVETENE